MHDRSFRFHLPCEFEHYSQPEKSPQAEAFWLDVKTLVNDDAAWVRIAAYVEIECVLRVEFEITRADDGGPNIDDRSFFFEYPTGMGKCSFNENSTKKKVVWLIWCCQQY